MAIQRVTFPSFIGDDYPPYEMRQLVSALDLRFTALETAINQELFDKTDIEDLRRLPPPDSQTQAQL